MNSERGQAMVLTGIALMGLVLFVMFLLITALSWFNTTAASKQALSRAAQAGAAELIRQEGLPLVGIEDPDNPTLPTATSRHCLDPVQARATTLSTLAHNLAWASPLYVKDDGAPLTPTEVISDTTGTYLIELAVVNPAALGCPASDPLPVYPPGATYDYDRPFVHLAVRLPMKALFGGVIVHPTYTVDVTSAVDPRGGAVTGQN